MGDAAAPHPEPQERPGPHSAGSAWATLIVCVTGCVTAKQPRRPHTGRRLLPPQAPGRHAHAAQCGPTAKTPPAAWSRSCRATTYFLAGDLLLAAAVARQGELGADLVVCLERSGQDVRGGTWGMPPLGSGLTPLSSRHAACGSKTPNLREGAGHGRVLQAPGSLRVLRTSSGGHQSSTGTSR